MSVRAMRLLLIGIGATCGVLVLLLLVQLAGFGRGYGWLNDEQGVKALDVGQIDRESFSLPPESTYAAVAARPLFNEDRRPTPVEAVAEEKPAAPPVPLNVSLTGVIISSKVRIAMVLDKARNQAQALKVGMPLEGDQAGWTVVEVKSRSVVFENQDKERNELELETSSVPLPAAAPAPPIQQPPPPRQSTKPGQPQPGQADGQAPKAGVEAEPAQATGNATNANEELVRRIEERRKQMRDEAEKLRQQQNRGDTPTGGAEQKKE